MTALSGDYDPKRANGEVVGGKVKASQTIYAGSLVMFATGTGLMEAGADSSGMAFAGVAKDYVVGNSSATSDVEVYTEGTYEFPIAAATQASVGLTAYIADSGTVGVYATPTNKIACGKIVEYVSATKVRIKIDGYAIAHPNALGDS